MLATYEPDQSSEIKKLTGVKKGHADGYLD